MNLILCDEISYYSTDSEYKIINLYCQVVTSLVACTKSAHNVDAEEGEYL